jgi:hypothetical protein
MLDEVQRAKNRRAILAEIARLGAVVPGTISQRTTRCAGAGCHCRAEPPTLHGPYPTWTHQENGRQVTKTLSASEVKQLAPAIAANKRLHELVKQLEQISIDEFEAQRQK